MANTVIAKSYPRNLIGDFWFSRSDTDVTPPSAPVLADPVTGTNFVSLLWTHGTDPETGVKETQVRHRVNGTSAWTTVLVPYDSGRGNHKVIEGLALGTPYDVQVGTVDYGGNVTYSAIKTVSTLGSSADLEPGTIAITTSAVSVNEGAQIAVEITRSGAGVSSGPVNVQWQVSGFPEGTPSPANNTLAFEAGENGPKSALTTAGLVGQDRTGVFRIAALEAPGSLIQPTLGTSQIALTIRDLTSVAGVKWHPGHYIFHGTNNQVPSTAILNEIAAMHEDVKGFLIAIYWGTLNPGNGLYDWTLIDQALAEAASRGLRVMVRIQDRSFGAYQQDLVVPADMAGNALYQGGYFQKPAGRMAKLWVASVQDRFMQFWAAFAARYDGNPWLEAVRTEETSPGSGISEGQDGYTLSAYMGFFRRFAREAPDYFPHTSVFVQANYGGQANVQALLADCWANRCGTGGPDLMPTFPGINGTPAHTPTYADRVYLGQRWNGSAWVSGGLDYKALGLLYANEIQGHQMGGKEGSWSPQQFYDYALELGQPYMIWLRKIFEYDAYPRQDLYWTNTGAPAGGYVPDVKTFLIAGGHPMNTTPPAYYSSVNTA